MLRLVMIYWKFIGNHLVNQLCKARDQIGNDWYKINTVNQKIWLLQQQYGKCYKKDKADWQMIGKQLAMIIT